MSSLLAGHSQLRKTLNNGQSVSQSCWQSRLSAHNSEYNEHTAELHDSLQSAVCQK